MLKKGGHRAADVLQHKDGERGTGERLSHTDQHGHHQPLIQTLVHTLNLEPITMIAMDGLRMQSNAIDYSGDLVCRTMADECLQYAERPIERVACTK